MKKELSRLVRLLASGEPVSGRVLGEEIGVSRTSVSKWVSQLGGFGMTVKRKAGVGYCLTDPLQLLQSDTVRKRLGDSAGRIISLDIFDSIASTNTWAMESLRRQLGDSDTIKPIAQDENNGFVVVLAEHQSSGRGRRGRSWVSPYAANINLSLSVRVYKSISDLSGLSLAIGIAIVKVLHAHKFIEARLKWPNDVLIDGRKLAGVLVDAQGEMDGPVDLCIGVGLNVRMQASEVAGLISQPWISLEEAADAKQLVVPERSLLAADLISEISKTVDLFMRHGFAYFQPAWSEFDAFADEVLELSTQLDPDSSRSAEDNRLPISAGLNMGVDEEGRLLMRPLDSEVALAYSGGEISVRRRKTKAEKQNSPADDGLTE
ncbi:biotin--[acetyl-CoA-carboxylase] ligase [Allohahella marinimesophila]|uniref:Bifunctional biotin--[acetyl-CoA-carboxylase] ligase/biotin operon repressor BirA n=1 Tax=Allohahella marinimesophila TaxID=1054972 RepID=A0ABP7QCT7_9GAMM